jgi:hypothetical protein
MVATSATAILNDITLSAFASVTPSGREIRCKTRKNTRFAAGLPTHCQPLALTREFP